MATMTIHMDEDNTGAAIKRCQAALLLGLEKMGLQGEKYTKKNIARPKMHANGVVRPNIDTTRLINSITHGVDTSDYTAYVGTNVEYAPYVELGTSKTWAYPYLKPAIQDNIQEYMQILTDTLKNA